MARRTAAAAAWRSSAGEGRRSRRWRIQRAGRGVRIRCRNQSQSHLVCFASELSPLQRGLITSNIFLDIYNIKYFYLHCFAQYIKYLVRFNKLCLNHVYRILNLFFGLNNNVYQNINNKAEANIP